MLEALKNANQFLRDAEVLIENGSYAHGAALAVLAIEEGAKAKIAIRYVTWDGKLEVDIKTYKKEIKSHFNKLSLAGKDFIVNGFLAHLIPEGSCSWKELSQRLKKIGIDKEFQKNLEIEGTMYTCLTFLKQKWLYVDIEREKVVSPLAWSKNDSKRVLSMAKKMVQKYETRIAEELSTESLQGT